MKGLIDEMANITKSNKNIDKINKTFNMIKPDKNVVLDNIDKMFDRL